MTVVDICVSTLVGGLITTLVVLAVLHARKASHLEIKKDQTRDMGVKIRAYYDTQQKFPSRP